MTIFKLLIGPFAFMLGLTLGFAHFVLFPIFTNPLVTLVKLAIVCAVGYVILFIGIPGTLAVLYVWGLIMVMRTIARENAGSTLRVEHGR